MQILKSCIPTVSYTHLIIGSSGSGKTTLLRCLNFLETPDRGRILVRDKVLFDAGDPATLRESEIRKKRLHFGMVFQSFNPVSYTHLDVYKRQPSRLAGPLPPPGVPFAPGEVYLSQGRFLRFYFGDGWVGAACGLELPPQNLSLIHI